VPTPVFERRDSWHSTCDGATHRTVDAAESAATRIDEVTDLSPRFQFWMGVMIWDWVNCNLLGRHENSVWCERGSIHLRCMRCGHRTQGWQVEERDLAFQAAPRLRARSLLRLATRRSA
jgi:hypothetical protein